MNTAQLSFGRGQECFLPTHAFVPLFLSDKSEFKRMCES